jgi:hypothetical protein
MGAGIPKAALFVVAMIAGMLLFEMLERRIKLTSGASSKRT